MTNNGDGRQHQPDEETLVASSTLGADALSVRLHGENLCDKRTALPTKIVLASSHPDKTAYRMCVIVIHASQEGYYKTLLIVQDT